MSYKLKKNFMYNIIYQIVALLVPLITMPYISRVIGPYGIGTYSYTFSIVSLAASFAVLGGDAHGNRSIARNNENQEQRSKVFWGIFIVQVISAIVASLVYIIYILYSHEYQWFLVLQGIHLLASLFNVNWYFYGRGQFKIMVIRSILVKLVTLASIFIFIRTPNDTAKYIALLSVCDLLSVVVVWPYILKDVTFVKLKVKDIVKNVKPMLVLFIPVIAMSLYRKMDKVMIGALSTVVQNGYYENVSKIITVPSNVITALGLVMLPQISNMLANDKKDESIILINGVMKKVIGLSCAMGFGIAAVSNEFVPLFWGKEFVPSIKLMTLMSPVIVFQAYSNMIRSAYLIPYQLDKVYVISTIAGAIVNFIINIFLIVRYGAVGAAIGTIIAELTVVGVQMWYVRSNLPVKNYIIEIIPFSLMGLIMLVCLQLLKGFIEYSLIITLLLQIFVGVLIFGILSLIYFNFNKIKNLIINVIC